MQAAAFAGGTTAVGTARGGTFSVRSRQDAYVRADAGQASTHFGFPSQRKHFVALFFSESKDNISQGHAF
jgi:hypothetical protein